MSTADIVNLIEDLDYGRFGLRAVDKTAAAGYVVGQDVDDVSYTWNDGDPTDESLDGVCALELSLDPTEDEVASMIERSDRLYMTSAKSLYLVAGDRVTYGVDEHEVIIHDAVCLAVVIQ